MVQKKSGKKLSHFPTNSNLNGAGASKVYYGLPKLLFYYSNVKGVTPLDDNILSIWQNAPQGEVLLKSLKDSDKEPKSALIDPYNYTGMTAGTRSKPTTVPYRTLRRMAQVPAIAAIILTRKNQVARFARRPRFEGDMGFQVRLKDKNQKMDDSHRKIAMQIEDFFLKTGGVPNKKRKDNFNTFLRKIVDDSLTLDTMVWENVPNLKGEPAEIWAVDASTIELVANSPVSEVYDLPVYVPNTKAGHKMGNDIAYVQRLNGQIIAEYAEEELAFGIRNPRTELLFSDFGMSEMEVLMEVVTGILNGVRYNTSYFSHSHLPQGVLEIVGKYQDKHLEGFKRHWKQLTSGAAGKWATPIMALEEGNGFKFTPFKQSNRDMEFNEFLEFLFNIASAVYQIDPNEVGFKSWTSQNSGMSQSDNTSEKIAQSKDKGFVPLMNFLSDTFNSEIVDRINDEFEFVWVGVDEQDEDKKLERQKGQLESGVKTVAMIWEENDMDLEKIAKDYGGELPKWAHAPANAQLIQVFMQENGMGGQEGEPGEDEDPNAEADQAQAAADDSHEKSKEMADDGHEKDIEKMEKEHEQTIEQKELEHKHNVELEKVKAKNKPEAPKKPTPKQPRKPSGKLQKSITDDDNVEVTFSWNDY
jgi:hypothetical protein